ncbi:MAG: hypothetical protein Fur0037_12100 [Planctomycetota bacterium]
MLASLDFRFLAHVDAALNAVATVLIALGLAAIRRRRERLHRALMLSAACVSAAFLACYLTYHLNAEPHGFAGSGAARAVYLALLASHVLLAAVQVPLIATTIVLGLRGRRERHRRWARRTAPLWLYVSISGVLVYLMLYHYPS